MKQNKVDFQNLVPKVPDHVLSRKNSDNTVSLVDVKEYDFFFNLDGVSAEFWSLIDGRRSVGHILERLEKEFSYDQKTLKKHFKPIVRNLVKNKLLSF